MKDERDKIIRGNFKVETLTHLGGMVGAPRGTSGLPGHLGNPVLSKEIPGDPCDHPVECHPGSKGS